MPASSIAHFETGTRKPSFESLRRLAIALEITTDYLLGRVDSPDLAAGRRSVVQGHRQADAATTARSPRTFWKCSPKRNAGKKDKDP